MGVTAEAEAKKISGASEFLPGVRKILISVALCDIAKTDEVYSLTKEWLYGEENCWIWRSWYHFMVGFNVQVWVCITHHS